MKQPLGFLDIMYRQKGINYYLQSPTTRLCTLDGSAFVRVSEEDLTNYLASKIVFVDTSALEATGYIKEADAGEALGADLFDAGAGVFTAGTYAWVAYGSNTIANDANQLKVTYDDNASGAYNYLRDSYDLSADLTLEKLYKLTFDAKVGAGDSVNVNIMQDGDSDIRSALSVTVTETNMTGKTIYLTANKIQTHYLNMQATMKAGEDIWLDNLVLKEVTHVGADGVHIVSTSGGVTRNWTSIDSGFDANNIASVYVY